MSRAVYEDDVIKLLNRGWKSGRYPLACDVRALPSAQPEIISCNQCVYYQQNHHYCEFLDTEFSPSDFCSQAERREE